MDAQNHQCWQLELVGYDDSNWEIYDFWGDLSEAIQQLSLYKNYASFEVKHISVTPVAKIK